MREQKEVEKELALSDKNNNKLKKEPCVVDAVQRSEFLSGKITSLPSDEVRIVMNEVINSPEFISLFERTLESSTRLAALRRNKAVKAEKRKRMREQSAPSPDAESVSEII